MNPQKDESGQEADHPEMESEHDAIDDRWNDQRSAAAEICHRCRREHQHGGVERGVILDIPEEQLSAARNGNERRKEERIDGIFEQCSGQPEDCRNSSNAEKDADELNRDDVTLSDIPRVQQLADAE